MEAASSRRAWGKHVQLRADGGRATEGVEDAAGTGGGERPRVSLVREEEPPKVGRSMDTMAVVSTATILEPSGSSPNASTRESAGSPNPFNCSALLWSANSELPAADEPTRPILFVEFKPSLEKRRGKKSKADVRLESSQRRC